MLFFYMNLFVKSFPVGLMPVHVCFFNLAVRLFPVNSIVPVDHGGDFVNVQIDASGK